MLLVSQTNKREQPAQTHLKHYRPITVWWHEWLGSRACWGKMCWYFHPIRVILHCKKKYTFI